MEGGSYEPARRMSIHGISHKSSDLSLKKAVPLTNLVTTVEQRNGVDFLQLKTAAMAVKVGCKVRAKSWLTKHHVIRLMCRQFHKSQSHRSFIVVSLAMLWSARNDSDAHQRM